MSGNFLWDVLIWFFALAGVMLMLCDIVRYFMYKNALPPKMCVLIPSDGLGKNCRTEIANLLNALYEKNPEGDYEIIVIDNPGSPEISQEIRILADAADCIYIANAENVAAYVRQYL